jgi:hypothetical protein
MTERKANRLRRFLIPVLGLCLLSGGIFNVIQTPDPVAAITGRTPQIDPARLYGRWVLEGDGFCDVPHTVFEYRPDGTVYYPRNTFGTSWRLDGDRIVETAVFEPVIVPREGQVASLINEFKRNPPASLHGFKTIEEYAAATAEAVIAAEMESINASDDTPPPRILRLGHETITIDYGFARGRWKRCGAHTGQR